jgi:competence protein ComEA
VFLLGAATALLALHVFQSQRWGSRPTDLQHGVPFGHQIELNRADRAELLQLPGVGENLARRIEQYRREHGRFRNVEELRKVAGIGPMTLEKLRDWVYVAEEDPDDEADPPVAAPRRAPAAVKREAVAPTPRQGAKAGGKKEAGLTEPIDINRADVTELRRLPGIGAVLSQRILDARNKGPFKSVDELRRVPGIGAKTLDKLRPYITVGKEPGLAARD